MQNRSHRGAKARVDSITADKFEELMRGGGSSGHGGGKDPNALSRWLRRKGRETVEHQMALLEKFNKQSAQDYIASQPALKTLSRLFHQIANYEGLAADVAAVKALAKYGFAPKARALA